MYIVCGQLGLKEDLTFCLLLKYTISTRMVICSCSTEEMEQLVKMHGLSLYFCHLQLDGSSFNALEIVDAC